MLRVLTLVDRAGPHGGGERLAYQLALGLDRDRFESHLCATRHGSAERASEVGRAAEAELAAAGVGFLGIPRESKTDLWRLAALRRYLREHRIDVLHAHKHGSNLWGAVVGTAARTPVIVAHEHSWSFEGRPLRVFLDRHVIARGADAVIAVSRADQERMTSVEGIPPERIRFVPNGSVAAAPQHDRATVRAELGIDEDAPVVVTAGALYDYKGFDVLIDAALLLAPRYPGLRVLIAGRGPEHDALERRIGGSDAVRLLGHRRDIADVIGAADVAVSSSHHEGSPLSVMEYMEAGLPVVGTRVGGVPDLIDDGVHGRLVPPGDAPALAAALAGLLDDPAAARAMGGAARERRRAEFDLSVTIGRVQDLYEELTARRRR